MAENDNELTGLLPLAIAGFVLWRLWPKPGAALVLPAAGDTGRNFTFEEAEAQRLLMRHQTIDGQNHLMCGGDQRVIRPPYLDLSRGGEAYIKTNSGVVQLGLVGSTTTVVRFQVPPRKNGTIEFIANQIIGGPGMEATGTIKWQVRADGVPIKNYDAIIATIGTTSNPADLRDSPIRIFENQQIDLVLVNVSQLPNQQYLSGMLRGKFYPLEQEGGNTWV